MRHFVFLSGSYKRGAGGQGTRSFTAMGKQRRTGSGSSAASLEAVTLWLSEKLRVGLVPRVSDIWDMVKREGLAVSRKEITALLQKDPVYLFNMHQQKKRLGSRKRRPIVTSALGFLHCDIGFFAKSRHYSTPPRCFRPASWLPRTSFLVTRTWWC